MDIVNLFFNAVPVWIWIVLAVVALAITVPYWLPVWLGLPRWIKGLIIVLGSLLVSYMFGRNKGFRDEQARREKASANAINNRNEVNDAITKMDAPAIDKRLDKWLRD